MLSTDLNSNQENDNVVSKHVSVAHKADALQDLIDNSSTPRPHVTYLQALGILPVSLSAKSEAVSTPSWAGATTILSSGSSSSLNFTPQANNPAINYLIYLGVSATLIEAMQAQYAAIIAEQVAARAQASVENAIINNLSSDQLASVNSNATQAQSAAIDAQATAEVVAQLVTTDIAGAINTANANAERAAADLATANAAHEAAANAAQQAALAAAAAIDAENAALREAAAAAERALAFANATARVADAQVAATAARAIAVKEAGEALDAWNTHLVAAWQRDNAINALNEAIEILTCAQTVRAGADEIAAAERGQANAASALARAREDESTTARTAATAADQAHGAAVEVIDAAQKAVMAADLAVVDANAAKDLTTTELNTAQANFAADPENNVLINALANAKSNDAAAAAGVSAARDAFNTVFVAARSAGEAIVEATQLLNDLNRAAADAADAALVAIDAEALQIEEATAANIAAAQALATEELTSDEVNRMTGVRDQAQIVTTRAAILWGPEDQEQINSDAVADAAEAELAAAEEALDDLNP